jgi:hypothetical protein
LSSIKLFMVVARILSGVIVGQAESHVLFSLMGGVVTKGRFNRRFMDE